MKIININPVSTSGRAEILDVLRGFSLMGIFLANIAVFSGYVFLDPSQKAALPTYVFDRWFTFAHFVLIHGKFYSLFSLLFGIGFSILMLRNEASGVNGFYIFYRRLFILIILGLLHSLFLWDGDILLLYAVIGSFLPLFNKTNNKILLIAVLLLLLSPILIDFLKLHFDFMSGKKLEELGQSIDKGNGIPLDQSVVFYLFQENAGYIEVLKWNEGGFFYRYAMLINSNRVPKVLAIFILGFYAGRKLMHVRLVENKKLLRSIQLYGFSIGILFGVALALLEMEVFVLSRGALSMLSAVAYAFGVVPLCLAYVATICLAWLSSSGQRILSIIAPAGRMALTNYIMQSVAGILLFYNVGLGLGLKFGPAVYIPLAITVYILQLIFSYFWLRYFNLGPLEWLWRQLTYGKYIPLWRSTHFAAGIIIIC